MIVFAVLASTSIMTQAGTAGIEGKYKGGQSEDQFQHTYCTYVDGGKPTGCPADYEYNTTMGGLAFQAWAHTDGDPDNSPVKMGYSLNKNGLWEWDFANTGTITVDGETVNHTGLLKLGVGHKYNSGAIAPNITEVVNGFHLTIGVPWTAHNRTTGIPIVDNGDGTYTGYIDFQVSNPTFNSPRAWLKITWDIVKDGDKITASTADGDNNGYPGTVMGSADSTPPWASFPFPFEPRWDGSAFKVAGDGDGSGSRDDSNSSSGGGCTYNPESKSIDFALMFMLAMSIFYPFRRRFLK